jgi:hypothetical protein
VFEVPTPHHGLVQALGPASPGGTTRTPLFTFANRPAPFRIGVVDRLRVGHPPRGGATRILSLRGEGWKSRLDIEATSVLSEGNDQAPPPQAPMITRRAGPRVANPSMHPRSG